MTGFTMLQIGKIQNVNHMTQTKHYSKKYYYITYYITIDYI